MAADTATKQNDTKPADSAKKATPKRKPASRAKAKSTTRSRSTRSASKSRKPAAARASRSEPTATTPATETPRPEAKALNGGQQFVAGVIDAQERTVAAIADYQTRAAELSQIPGASAIAGAQAQLLRGATDAYVSAARSLLK
jgi:hypothetical protein